MRRGRGVILRVGPGPWRIGRAGTAWVQTDIAENAGAEEIAAKLPEALERVGCRGAEAIVALPSETCLSASLATAALPRKDRRRAMEYRLEEKFPFAIEEVAADFVLHNGRALGVCARVDAMKPLLEAITRCGVKIAAVCPAAILTFQGGGTSDEADAIVWQSGESAEVFVLEDGDLVDWHSVPATAQDIALVLLGGRQSSRVALRGTTKELRSRLENLPGVRIVSDEAVAEDEAALTAAGRVIRGEIEALVDLRREVSRRIALRRPLRAAVAAGVFLCLSVMATLLWRGHEYSAAAARCDQNEREVFGEVFPGEPAPMGVESRLSSYASQIRGPVAVEHSALPLMREVLASLPTDLKFQMDQMQFDPERATLSGQTTTMDSANQIAKALRGSPQLTVEEPTIEAIGDGERFTITAKPRSAR